jgi:cytochrome c peroxidase
MIRRVRNRLVTYPQRRTANLAWLAISFCIVICLLKVGTSISGMRDALRKPSTAMPHEPITPLPVSVPTDAKRVALGQQLFHDVRLSRDNTISCAACHPLEHGGMDGRRGVIAANGLYIRNTPTIFNVQFNPFFNWDGIATSLEQQAELVFFNPRLMHTNWPDVLGKLRADGDYIARFKSAYSQEPTRANVLDALTSYERSLVTPNARFDRYLRGEQHVLNAEEKQGYELFKSYGCVSCHQGINVGGNMFQKFGVFADTSAKASPDTTPDPGRYAVTEVPRDREVFRVPSLRNVALTAPYFHDGRAATLEEAVTTMAEVQLGRRLTPKDIRSIVQFLHSLTGEYQGRPLTRPTEKAR